MATVSMHDEERYFNLKIPWEGNTVKAFGLALCTLLIFLLFGRIFSVKPIIQVNSEITVIPIDVLNFGDGDGTGLRKGNLSLEGAANKGDKPSSDLADAEKSAKTAKSAEFSDHPENAGEIIPAHKLPSDKNNNNPGGSSTKNIGSVNGNPNGSGTGTNGTGPGAGQGYGNIDWGGGGNRTVLAKPIPKFPKDAPEGTIRIRFTVLPDGTVSSMVPLQKSDPSLERAAMDALRKWRFNSLKEQRQMVGIITFSFRLS